jgi:phage N-6-adenine-methyltransferase
MGNLDWETPDEFFNKCSEAFGPFGIDAAASKNNTKCSYYMSEKTNALDASWPIDVGAAWLNPPYKNIMNWVLKAVDESREGLLVCMLLPNDTDTKWFHLLCNFAEIYVTKGRIKFIDPEENGRSSPRQGHIVAVLRPPVEGLIRPTGVIGRIDA